MFWLTAARAGLLVAAAGGLGAWVRAVASGAAVPDRQRLLLALAVALVAVAIGATSWFREPWLASVAIVAAAGAWSARGQSAVANGAVGGVLDTVHLLAAVTWVGALGLLVVDLWRARRTGEGAGLLARARGYARLALILVGVLAGAGLGSAVLVLNRPGELWATGYGRLLLAKTALFVAALAVAVASRRRGLRRGALGLMRRLTPAEAGLLAVVLVLSGVLVNTAPPAPAAAASVLLGPPPMSGRVVRDAGPAGMLTVAVAADGRQLRVEVFAPGDDPAGLELDVEGKLPGGRGVSLEPRPCGTGCFSQEFALPPGRTELTVGVSADTWEGGSFDTSLDWPPPPADPQLLARLVQMMRAVPLVELTEQTSSGPDATGPLLDFELSGGAFIDTEPYAARTADDVHPLPGAEPGFRFYISGDRIWVTVWLDDQGRLARERIVNIGHVIERTFTYPES